MSEFLPRSNARAAVLPGRDSGVLRLLDHIRYYLLLAAFPILCLGWSLPAQLMVYGLPRRWQPGLGRFGIRHGFRLYLGLMRLCRVAQFDIAALDAVAGEGGLLIIANHRSLLDAVLMLSRLPRGTCITKASLWRTPILGGGVRLAGYIPNDAPLPLIRAGVAALKRGETLVVFPEGTRATGPLDQPFKSGFALMAKAAGVPVQTVLLESNSRFLGKGWPKLQKPDFPLRYRARLGRRFDLQGRDVHEAATEIEAYYRAELAHERLSPWP